MSFQGIDRESRCPYLMDFPVPPLSQNGFRNVCGDFGWLWICDLLILSDSPLLAYIIPL